MERACALHAGLSSPSAQPATCGRTGQLGWATPALCFARVGAWCADWAARFGRTSLPHFRSATLTFEQSRKELLASVRESMPRQAAPSQGQLHRDMRTHKGCACVER
eukprot:364532-Chlamydomonas_euryale.AAC.3